jgi:hypothetical protein
MHGAVQMSWGQQQSRREHHCQIQVSATRSCGVPLMRTVVVVHRGCVVSRMTHDRVRACVRGINETVSIVD